jgi:glycosyltransferase involved in cell wall biosynthesis
MIMKNPLVSIVITTRNEERYLGRTLSALKKQTYRPLEIIVSDAESTDKTVQVAKKFGARTVIKRTSVPEGRNLGAEKAIGEILVFVDADTMLEEDWVERAVNDLKKKDVDMVLGVFHSVEKSFRAKIVCYVWSDILPSTLRIFGLKIHGAPATLALRRTFFAINGGYNGNVKFGDDAEIIVRLSKKGNLMWDKKLVARTSMRRFEKGGYFRWGLFWLIGGLGLIFFGKPPQNDYKVIR